jgi:hypothetical protein
MFRLSLFLPFLVLFAPPAGCKSGPAAPDNLAPVSGRITLRNEPLKGANVRFQPVKGGGDSYGTTDDDGRYTLRYGGGTGIADGAIIGSHNVQITKLDRNQDGKELVPDRYNTNSHLTCDVPAGGKKDADYNLK